MCVRAHELCPVIRPGDCGSLLTSMPNNNSLIVLGMLVGMLSQEAEDGGDPKEYYIAYQLQQALEKSQTFQNQNYVFCPAKTVAIR